MHCCFRVACRFDCSVCYVLALLPAAAYMASAKKLMMTRRQLRSAPSWARSTCWTTADKHVCSSQFAVAVRRRSNRSWERTSFVWCVIHTPPPSPAAPCTLFPLASTVQCTRRGSAVTLISRRTKYLRGYGNNFCPTGQKFCQQGSAGGVRIDQGGWQGREGEEGGVGR